MGEGGLEPPRPEGHRHLKPARLPIRPSPKTTAGAYHGDHLRPQPDPMPRRRETDTGRTAVTWEYMILRVLLLHE